MKIAILVPDNREICREYHLNEPYFGTAPTALFDGFAMLPGEVEVHVISCTQRKMRAPEKLAQNVWFHLLDVPKIGWLRSAYFGCAMAVRRKLGEIHPDLVHAQGTERDCAMSAIQSPYPRLLTIHGNLRLIRNQVGFSMFSALWFQSYLEGWVVPRFNGVICISNYTRNAVEKETPKTWVIPNAVDQTFLIEGEKKMRGESDERSLITHRHDQSSTPVILCVANIEHRKNQNMFIRAMDAVRSCLSFEIRFFGRCNDDEYGREFRSLLNNRPWCSYGGMLQRDELRKQFAEANLLVLPTREDNCPMVVLEAQAAGVPVVASNVGGIPDLIEEGVTGVMIDPKDELSIQQAVERVLTDQLFGRSLAHHAFLHAQGSYAPLQVALKHLHVYREVLSKK